MAYDDADQIVCTWRSDAASIVESKRLVYVYLCDRRGGQSRQGIADFTLVRKDGRGRPASLDGWANDQVDDIKDPNTEYKVASTWLSSEAALRKARHRFGPTGTGGCASAEPS